MSKRNYPEFKVPDSYLVPEGVNEGETFEDISTFKVKANGQICIVKIGDSPLLDDSGKSAGEDEEPADYGTPQGMENRITQAFKERG